MNLLRQSNARGLVSYLLLPIMMAAFLPTFADSVVPIMSFKPTSAESQHKAHEA